MPWDNKNNGPWNGGNNPWGKKDSNNKWEKAMPLEFLNHTENKGYFNLFIPGSSSHAVTEVLTSRGWLGVDSNEPFILVDKANSPFTYEQAIHNGVIDIHTENSFYKKPLTYVIGLYSRNGTFIEPYLPYIPEINFNDFFGNFINITIINPIIIV